MALLPPTPLTLGQYIAALIEAVGNIYPAALARIRLIVGDRRARIRLDDEEVEIMFDGATLQVSVPGEISLISGEGVTDSATVLELLDGYLEVTEAILSGRLQASGLVSDIIRMFSAIEIILDASARAPELQAVAQRFRRERPGTSTRTLPKVVHSYSYPFRPGAAELELLSSLDLLSNAPNRSSEALD